MSIYTKLLAIQHELNAPKDQHNDFGNFNYRSAESILAAVKPLLWEQQCVLILSDDVEGDSVTATATIIDTGASGPLPEEGMKHDTGYVSVTAYAKHPVSKKGMDDSQVTGATSSYARKYALNGLFAIDDVKDADALPPDSSPSKPKTKESPKEKTNGAATASTGQKQRSRKLQEVYDKTMLLASITGEKPGEIARKLESAIGHPVNEELNAAHYARIGIWFAEQGVTDES